LEFSDVILSWMVLNFVSLCLIGLAKSVFCRALASAWKRSLGAFRWFWHPYVKSLKNTQKMDAFSAENLFVIAHPKALSNTLLTRQCFKTWHCTWSCWCFEINFIGSILDSDLYWKLKNFLIHRLMMYYVTILVLPCLW